MKNDNIKVSFAKSTLKKIGISAEQAACIKLCGNSMEPVMPDGCTVGVDTSNKHIKDGDIYAIHYDGQLQVKLLYRTLGGGVRIHSYNHDEHQDIHCAGDDMGKLNVLGRVFWWSVMT